MEKQPLEVLEVLTKYLSVRDLAACCAVSRRWREIFNQDPLWKPYCRPTLEEHLRTTPCMVEPPFVSPEDEFSTLTRICKWRLAFLRESHLWKNLMSKQNHTYILPKDHDELCRTFMTNDVFVRLFKGRIEIWDASKCPPAFVTSCSLRDHHCFCCRNLSVVDSETLVFINKFYLLAFHVDMKAKIISVKYKLNLSSVPRSITYLNTWYGSPLHYIHFHRDVSYVIKGTTMILLHKSDPTKLQIWNLETGEKLKEEFCQQLPGQHNITQFHNIHDSVKSDNITIVSYESLEDNIHVDFSKTIRYYYHIYNPKESVFLPFTEKSQKVFIDTMSDDLNLIETCVMFENYLAIRDPNQVRVFNYQTSKPLFKFAGSWCSHLDLFHNNFIFYDRGNSSLRMFCPADNTVSYIFLDICELKKINDKLLILYTYEDGYKKVYKVMKAEGTSIKPFDVNPMFDDIVTCSTSLSVNQAFTKGIENLSVVCEELTDVTPRLMSWFKVKQRHLNTNKRIYYFW